MPNTDLETISCGISHTDDKEISYQELLSLLPDVIRTLDKISLRATSRSSVGLAPKISNDVIHDLDNDLIKSQSSRGIILLLLLITK